MSEDYIACSNRLKKFIMEDKLSYKEVYPTTQNFFDTHRDIMKDNNHSFWIRMTVQYNLFVGSILNLGTENQKRWIIENQSKGELGCFMLTEYRAGVTSGLIVNTEAHIKGDKIEISTPDIRRDKNGEIDFENTLDRKNWISQGLTADWGCVIVTLYKDNVNIGIHPLLINMYLDGIYKKSNNKKNVAISLDNAMVIFDKVIVPISSIMNDSEPSTKNGFPRIASRLNSGRLCIAYSGLGATEKYLNEIEMKLSKEVYLSKKHKSLLRDIPEIRDSIKNSKFRLSRLNEYVKNVIQEYLLDKEDLISKIIVAKILSVNFSLDVAYKYKLICGSNSLFEEDMIGIALCGSFAEGDNNVLAYKLVMDNILSPSKYLSSYTKQKLFLFSKKMIVSDNKTKVFYDNYEQVKDISIRICEDYLFLRSSL